MRTHFSGRIVIFGLALVFSLTCFGQSPMTAPRETGKQLPALEPGQIVEKQISSGERHLYKVRLEAGQYAKFEADQLGCDVVFSLVTPDGQNLLVLRNENEGDGVEAAGSAVESAGEYELRVSSMHGAAAAGTYRLKIAELRPATPKELSFSAGMKLFDEAFMLTRENATADSIRLGMGKFTEAVEKYREGGSPMREGITLRNIGALYDRLGNRQKGIEWKTAALPRFHAAGYKYGEFWVHRDLGTTYLELGDLESALGSLLKAVEYFPILEHPGNKADTLCSFGKLYQQLGDLDRAIVYYNEALAFATEETEVLTYRGTVNNDLGQAYLLAGDNQRAREHFQAALDVTRKSKNRHSEAAYLINLSKALLALGESERALSLLHDSLAINRSLGLKPGEGAVLKAIGGHYLTLGDTARALEYLNSALQVYRSIEDTQNVPETLLSIARAECKNGDLANAQAHNEEAIALIEGIRARFCVGNLRDRFSASLQEYYALYVDILMERSAGEPGKNYAALALQANERGRARGLINLLAESNANIREGVDPALLQKEKELTGLLSARMENLTRVLAGKADPEKTNALKIEIEHIRAENEQNQAAIRRTSRHYADLTQPQTLDVRQIQTGILDDRSALLEYALGDAKSYLWIVTRDSVRSVELRPKAEIEAAARLFYDALTARNREIKFETAEEREARIAQADLRLADHSKALSRMILAPAAASLANKDLLVVADGALQYVPFAALAVPAGKQALADWNFDGGSRYLIESNVVVNLPSASALAVLRKETANRKMPAKTLSVFADPVFDLDDERYREAVRNKPAGKPEFITIAKKQARGISEIRTREGLDLVRLPFTRREAETITSFVPAAQQDKRLDFAASRSAAMSAELANYRYVHFATHGFINSENPELSGLALSMFDENGAPQDGFLRIGDIYNMKLPAEMAVLSGCRTGLGKDVRGEGLMGLTRGFMYAGARRVTVSLWDINDEATADLMGRFYRDLLGDKKLRPALALRQAQIALINDGRWRHPYFWAAFAMQGEPK